MAGGKLTPRQKMINLMYLVFIAMLALNMSKEVLSAFGILNNKIVESNGITDVRNQSTFEQLAQNNMVTKKLRLIKFERCVKT
jgi:hypothetical protein